MSPKLFMITNSNSKIHNKLCCQKYKQRSTNCIYSYHLKFIRQFSNDRPLKILLGNFALNSTLSTKICKIKFKNTNLTNSKHVSAYLGYRQYNAIILNRVITNFELKLDKKNVFDKVDVV